MKTFPTSHLLTLSSAAILILLTACGGGGSPALTSSQISGAVIDGYIEGAKVCLDVNSNGTCDSGEPSATTSAKGAYNLDTTGVGTTGLNVIAEIPASAKDSDDDGQTLAAAGKSAYTMATPADKPAVISPLTTLLVGKIAVDNISLAQASSKVLAQLGLPEGTDLHEDHVAKGNIAVNDAARQVAAQLQALQGSMGSNISGADRWVKLQQARDEAERAAGSISKTSNTLNMPASLANVANGKLLAYRMNSAKGQAISATAMLFTPKTATPSTGWPLLVFGHGTTGLEAECAPSVTMNASGTWDYASLVASLVAQGMVVIAPDYEGLGSREMGVVPGHPYLDLRSAGQSMALAAVAAKKQLSNSLSGDWATLGHSQGGHAALAGAQFSSLAKQLDSGLNYKGAVAIAPASNLLFSLNTMGAALAAAAPADYSNAYSTLINANLYAAYVVRGAQSTPTPISAHGLLGSRMLAVYNSSVDKGCLNEFVTAIARDVSAYSVTANAAPKDYPGVSLSAVNAAKLAALLAAREPGQSKLPGKTLIVQGSADTTVLPLSTDKLIDTMKAKGSDVTRSFHNSPTATHSGVLALQAAQLDMTAHVRALFGLVGGGGSGNPVSP
ncbi:MAG: hypothetical protein WCK08_14780 [Betaproteobacteria bacterium]